MTVSCERRDNCALRTRACVEHSRVGGGLSSDARPHTLADRQRCGNGALALFHSLQAHVARQSVSSRNVASMARWLSWERRQRGAPRQMFVRSNYWTCHTAAAVRWCRIARRGRRASRTLLRMAGRCGDRCTCRSSGCASRQRVRDNCAGPHDVRRATPYPHASHPFA